jgi:lysophospholipase L1-like esterase
MKARTAKLCMATVAAALVPLSAEVALRLAGRPRGTFVPVFRSESGLYPPNATIPMTWGPVPYIVRSNSLGFRGREIQRQKPAGTVRIATIGDSVTDGFFVDNEATWQYVLEGLLRERLATPVEVVNCARGGGSVDWALRLLERFALPLTPDLVILTFVTNDITDLGDGLKYAVEMREGQGAMFGRAETAAQWLATRSAVGETLMDAYFTVRFRVYRESKPIRSLTRERIAELGDRRYAIAGGEDAARNLAEFRRRFADTHGRVVADPWEPEIEALLRRYEEGFRRLVQACRSGGTKLVCVYFSPYLQVYDDAASRRINRELQRLCRAEDVPLVDLTDGFVAQRRRALYLAPTDDHLTPEGNRLFAELVAKDLAGRLAGAGKP